MAVDDSGIAYTGYEIWDVAGKDGALSAGSMRGVRFAQGFGYRYWGGRLMALSGDRNLPGHAVLLSHDALDDEGSTPRGSSRQTVNVHPGLLFGGLSVWSPTASPNWARVNNPVYL